MSEEVLRTKSYRGDFPMGLGDRSLQLRKHVKSTHRFLTSVGFVEEEDIEYRVYQPSDDYQDYRYNIFTYAPEQPIASGPDAARLWWDALRSVVRYRNEIKRSWAKSVAYVKEQVRTQERACGRCKFAVENHFYPPNVYARAEVNCHRHPTVVSKQETSWCADFQERTTT